MQKTRIWDLPTRIFHWALVLCFIGLVASGQIGGTAMDWHFRFGYAVLSLLLFRVVWGLVGGRWSRFSEFSLRPSALKAYLRGEAAPLTRVGHSPLGALSVVAMLGVLALQVATGLMSDDEIATSGPLTTKVPGTWVTWASDYHTEVGKLLLLALVVSHLLAIVYYHWRKKEDLLRPMLHGDKALTFAAPATRDDVWTRLAAALVLALCSGAVFALLQWAQS